MPPVNSTGDDCEHFIIILTSDISFYRVCQGCYLGLFFPFVTGSPHQHDVSETGSVRSVVLILLKERLIGSLLAPSFCLPKSMICQMASNFRIQTLSNHFSIYVNGIQSPLTLRLLMSYIYMEHPFLMFLDHTRRRSIVGRTPLDE